MAYCLSDWLDLHGLTAGQCASVLSRAPAVGTGDARSRHCDLSGDTAWYVAADAMIASFPFAAPLIERLRDSAGRVFSAEGAGPARPFTIPIGPDRLPAVHLRYRGRVVDLLTVAHEFGHAVQIAASGSRFVPPVTREICAFLSELALLTWLRGTLPVLHPHALAAWEMGNRSYLHRDREALALALRNRRSVYRYCWNYPIARVLASECVEQLPPDHLWAIFENRLPLMGIVQFLGCPGRFGSSCTAACIGLAAALQADR